MLPDCEVGVLEPRLGERRGSAGGEGTVERGQLGEEERDRPVVRNDVMEEEEQPVLAGTEPEQQSPQDRASFEVERAPPLRARQLSRDRSSLAARQAGEIDPPQANRGGRGGQDALHRPAGDVRVDRPQHLVPADDLGQGPAEGRRVERPGERDLHRGVVSRGAGGPALDEPELLLGVGERDLDLLAARPRRDLAAAADLFHTGFNTGEGRLHPPGEGGDRRVVVEIAPPRARPRAPRAPASAPGWL